MQENVRTKIAAGEETEREGKLLLYQWRTVNCKMLAVNHLNLTRYGRFNNRRW